MLCPLSYSQGLHIGDGGPFGNGGVILKIGPAKQWGGRDCKAVYLTLTHIIEAASLFTFRLFRRKGGGRPRMPWSRVNPIHVAKFSESAPRRAFCRAQIFLAGRRGPQCTGRLTVFWCKSAPLAHRSRYSLSRFSRRPFYRLQPRRGRFAMVSGDGYERTDIHSGMI